jgi:hypothetical protein
MKIYTTLGFDKRIPNKKNPCIGRQGSEEYSGLKQATQSGVKQAR